MKSRPFCLVLNNFSAVKMATHAFLFPGQGSQYVGMTQKLSNRPAVESIFRKAENILGYDLQSLCVSGPQSRLEETVNCQPAVMAASLAAVQSLKQEKPEVGGARFSHTVLDTCRATAGFSVGEITALTFAEALSLESGLQLIHVRAMAMQEACLQCAGTMLTVIGLTEAELERLCHAVRIEGGEDVCIANFIFPRGYVISGSVCAVDTVGIRAQEAGANIKKVDVSGAFHSPLMQPAVKNLQSVLDKIQIEVPRIPVYSNVTGQPFSSVDEIRDSLALQVTQPVRWETVVRNMIRDHTNIRFCEIGPGKQLKAMLGRIDKDAYKQCLNIQA